MSNTAFNIMLFGSAICLILAVGLINYIAAGECVKKGKTLTYCEGVER